MSPAPQALAQRQLGWRHLRVFGLTTALLFAVVAGVNRHLLDVIASPQNQRILQNNVGWERTYKPILFDRLRPRVAAFGASWARDAFDYEEVSTYFGREFFNFAASGAQPYENFRFLQSALALGTLDTVLLNLDSFSTHQRRPPTQYGFNEDILSVRADGQPTPLRDWHRFFATTLSGAAIASNVSSLKMMEQAREGRPKQSLLRAYDRAQYAPHAASLAMMKAQILPTGQALAIDAALPDAAAGDEDIAAQQENLGWLRQALQAVCTRPLQVHAYYTPHHASSFWTEKGHRKILARKLATLALFQQARQGCRAKLHLHDFFYPNAVVLEGILRPAVQGHWYRSDFHPRPTVGLKMLDVMTGKAPAAEDFGPDLLAMEGSGAGAWLVIRHARWFGRWQREDRSALESSAALPAPAP